MKHVLITQYQSLMDNITALRAEAKAAASQILQETTAEYFAKYSDTVEQIFFRIYTPWFNDGEACEITIDEPRVVLVADPYEEKYDEGSYLGDNIEYYEYKLCDWGLFNADPEAYKDAIELASPGCFTRWSPRENYKPHYESVEELLIKIKQVKAYPEGFVEDTNTIMQFIASLEETMLEELFGNHVLVRIAASGVETEEYSHE
jgi:hypothetical protein